MEWEAIVDCLEIEGGQNYRLKILNARPVGSESIVFPNDVLLLKGSDRFQIYTTGQEIRYTTSTDGYAQLL
jgi:hypothetical protein